MIQLHPEGKSGPQCSLVPRGPVEPGARRTVRPWRPLHMMRPGFPGGCSVLAPEGGLTSAPSHCRSPAPGSLETDPFWAHERGGAYRSSTSGWAGRARCPCSLLVERISFPADSSYASHPGRHTGTGTRGESQPSTEAVKWGAVFQTLPRTKNIQCAGLEPRGPVVWPRGPGRRDPVTSWTTGSLLGNIYLNSQYFPGFCSHSCWFFYE